MFIRHAPVHGGLLMEVGQHVMGRADELADR